MGLKKREPSSLGLKGSKKLSSKEPSNDVVVIDHTAEIKPKKKKRGLSSAKAKAERLQEQIPDETQLMESIPDNITNQERRQIKEYMDMFNMLSKLIRKSRKQCLSSGQSRDYYALCTLLSQQREVIADIRSISDMSGQVSQLDTNVLQPMVRSIGQNLLDSYYQMRKLILETCVPEQTKFALSKLDDIARDQGQFLQNQYSSSMSKINEVMLG